MHRYLLPFSALAILGLGWELAPRMGLVSPRILPPLSVVLQELRVLTTEKFFWQSVWSTATETALGFTLGAGIGFLIGGLGVMSQWFRESVLPYVVGIQNTPRVALAPLFLIWFGFGIASKVAMSAAISFFPVAIGTAVGLRATDADLVHQLKSLGADRRQFYWYLTLPTAAPYVFAGLKTAVGLALAGTIVAEFVSSSSGLGFMIAQASFIVDIPRIFAILLVLAILGGLLFFALELLDRRVVFWRTATRQ